MPSDITPQIIKKLGVLIPIGVVLLALALVLPAIQQARMAARNSQTKNNLREISRAMGIYHDVTGSLPSSVSSDASHTVD